MRQDVFLRLAVQSIPVVIRSVYGLTQPQAMSTTSTYTGPVVPQLTINIVARHMVNSLVFSHFFSWPSATSVPPLLERIKFLPHTKPHNLFEQLSGISLG